jgi:hypothetical protein
MDVETGAHTLRPILNLKIMFIIQKEVKFFPN